MMIRFRSLVLEINFRRLYGAQFRLGCFGTFGYLRRTGDYQIREYLLDVHAKRSDKKVASFLKRQKIELLNQATDH